MRDLIDGRHTNEVWFCCGILTIIGRDNKYNKYVDRITIKDTTIGGETFNGKD